MSDVRRKQIQVSAPWGRLCHEVRVTLEDGIWIARIVTLPNQIWVEPGGVRALKFRALTAEGAEERAVEFAVRDARARGYHREEGAVQYPGIDPEAPARRIFAEFPVRFMSRSTRVVGAARQPLPALTHNLSESGLFIVSGTILQPGSRLSIELRLSGIPERLEGKVVWGRHIAAQGFVRGMGVCLLDPSFSYRARVQSLR